jgi:hypothetical protein
MTQMGNYSDDFASFLHCPQNFRSKKEEAAITAATRAHTRFGHRDPKEFIETLLAKYINKDANLEKTGLCRVYAKIKQEVIEKNLFYLILIGYYEMRDSSPKLCDYLTVKRNKIELTVESVCIALMRDFFSTQEEREILTEATPNFSIYYNE